MSNSEHLKADADAAFKAGQLGAAIDLYRAALDAQPAWAAAHNNLAMALRQQGDVSAAESHFREALKSEPDLVGALSNLGALLVEQGRLDEADGLLSRAVNLQPENAGVLYNLGLLAMQRGEDEVAIGSLRRSIALKPTFAPAFFTLGNLCLRVPDYTDALANFDQALALNPSHKHAALNRAKALSGLGRSVDAYGSLRRALNIDPTFAAAHSNLIFKQQYDPNISAADLFAEAQVWNAAHASQPNAGSLATNTDPDRVLRVGYLSPHFTDHPVGYFLEPVLANHDPENVSVICYSDSLVDGPQSRRLRANTVTWHDVNGEKDGALAERIRADGIDILIDLDGHSGPNRLPVFARRAASLQVTWAGYVGTTGLDAMDYLITDSRQTIETDLSLITEQPVYMPGNYVALAPILNAPDVGPCPSRQNGFITFGCFNALDKINGQVISLWSEILSAVPGSRLSLITFDLGDPAVRARIERMFADHGVAANRLDLSGKLPRQDLLNAYNAIDIALDPFPYSGGLTTLESLWMGVPVITKRDGDRFACRHSTTHLTALGFMECVADDAEDYVTRVVSLAADADRRATLRQKSREMMRSSPVCDGAAFTRALEQAYRVMWQRFCAGEKPTAITESDLDS